MLSAVFAPSVAIHLGSSLGLSEDLEGQLLEKRMLCPVGKSEESQSLKGSEICTWEDWGQQKSVIHSSGKSFLRQVYVGEPYPVANKGEKDRKARWSQTHVARIKMKSLCNALIKN